MRLLLHEARRYRNIQSWNYHLALVSHYIICPEEINRKRSGTMTFNSDKKKNVRLESLYYHFKVVFERNAVDETVSSSECQGCFIKRIGQKLLSKSVAWCRERRLSEVQHQPAHRNSGTQMWACLIVYFWRTWLGGYELSTKSAWNEMKSWLDGKFGEVTITSAIHFPIIPQTRRTFRRGLITFFLQAFHRRHLPRNGNMSRSIHHSGHSTQYRLSQEINKANFNNPPLNPNMIKKKKKNALEFTVRCLQADKKKKKQPSPFPHDCCSWTLRVIVAALKQICCDPAPRRAVGQETRAMWRQGEK